MDEKRKKILKISVISLFVILFLTSIALASILIVKNKQIEQVKKDNQEIIERLENIESE